MNKRNISYRVNNRKNTRNTLKNRKKQKGGKNLIRTNGDIHQAVNKWCEDKESATSEYGDISEWDTSSVTNMSQLFNDKNDFNNDISKWNVSNVTDMSDMFDTAAAFNQPIGSWNVSKVTTMTRMFRDAAAFNQPIDKWNVSKVTYMDRMFDRAETFNQNLTKWKITSVFATNKETKSKLKYYMNFGNRMEERNYPIFGIEIREEEKKDEITALFKRKKELEQQIKKKEENREKIGNDVKVLKVIETILNGWSESDTELYKSLEPNKGGNRKTKKNKNSKRKTIKRFIKNK